MCLGMQDGRGEGPLFKKLTPKKKLESGVGERRELGGGRHNLSRWTSPAWPQTNEADAKGAALDETDRGQKGKNKAWQAPRPEK